MSNKKIAERIYKLYLDEVYKIIGNNHTTTLSQISNAGKYLFRDLYAGTFPYDRLPDLTDQKPYAIINTDDASKSGTHWVAVVKVKGTNKYIFYDSFGRPKQKILSDLHIAGGKIANTEQDAEQQTLETNCGQRCLSFLLVYHNHGEKIAMYI